MATYRVYKFRGHEYFFGLLFRGQTITGREVTYQPYFRFQLQGDLYLPETHWSRFHLYLAQAAYDAMAALYGGSIQRYELSPEQVILEGHPDFQDRVSVTTFVEPTSGDTEVVYRRVRLRDRVLYFALSPSAEVDPGDVDLGPLTRPAPRLLVSEEVAAKFRHSEECHCGKSE
jgi:hypothetical protein